MVGSVTDKRLVGTGVKIAIVVMNEGYRAKVAEIDDGGDV